MQAVLDIVDIYCTILKKNTALIKTTAEELHLPNITMFATVVLYIFL